MKLVLEEVVKEERNVPELGSDKGKMGLKDVKIGDIEGYTLHFGGSKGNELGVFNLYFNGNPNNNWEFRIHLSEKGIRFERVVYRPHHDDSNIEHLCVAVNEELAHQKDGTLKWIEKYPLPIEGWDHFYVPFGAVMAKY